MCFSSGVLGRSLGDGPGTGAGELTPGSMNCGNVGGTGGGAPGGLRLRSRVWKSLVGYVRAGVIAQACDGSWNVFVN